jgi:hypothetical protein
VTNHSPGHGKDSISPALAEFLRGTERPILDAIIEAGT